MLEEGRISSKQLQWLIITSMLPTVLLILPTSVTTYAKQDGWLTIIIIGLIGLITAYILTKLGSKFPNKTIIGYSPLIVGKYLGKVIAFIYILFFLHITSVIIREFGEVLSSFLLQKTPLTLIIAVTIIVSASAVRNGIEVISRVNELVLPLVISFLIIIYIY
jgi:spore germination protein KB